MKLLVLGGTVFLGRHVAAEALARGHELTLFTRGIHGADLFPEAERRLGLLHCVLCHHGPDAAPGRRFGSPEALALYRLNALDASVKGALEHGLP